MATMVDAIPVPRASTRSKAVVSLFAVALFLSAFLLFSVEPIIAKALLPTLGGAPMVWNTCVAFFQFVLLGGYIYAHGAAAWMGKRRHVAVYAVLLALPFVVLPFATRVTATPSPDASPIVWLLLALFGLIGLPFFVLSTSAAVLQTWFSKTDDPTARDPYFLYAASNLGSLLALVSYPTFVEPMLRLQDQSRVWAVGYAVFVVVCNLSCDRGVAHRLMVSGRADSEVARDRRRCRGCAIGRRIPTAACEMGRPIIRSVEPDARGDELSVDRYRRSPAALGRPAVAISADLRDRIRLTCAGRVRVCQSLPAAGDSAAGSDDGGDGAADSAGTPSRFTC